MKKSLITALSLISTSAMAHTGHLPSETIHGLLHIEHIIMLAAGLIVYIVSLSRRK